MYSDDIMYYIKSYLTDVNDLVNLKLTCKYFDNTITHFTLGKMMLETKFNKYKHIEMCVNVDCYYDTQDLFEDIYNLGDRRYIHSHQPALNHTNISYNSNYRLNIPYCTECFMVYMV
jgi:hypothetical protein